MNGGIIGKLNTTKSGLWSVEDVFLDVNNIRTGWSREGLLVEYMMDSVSGGVLIDSSGNGRNGTISGATIVTLSGMQAMHFDGVNDYAEIPNIGNLGDRATVSFWGSEKFFISASLNNSGTTDDDGNRIFMSTSNYFNIDAIAVNVVSHENAGAISAFVPWAIVKNGLDCKIYRDGALFFSGSSCNWDLNLDPQKKEFGVLIGCAGRDIPSGAPVAFMLGNMAKLRMWARNLSVAEISRLRDEV